MSGGETAPELLFWGVYGRSSALRGRSVLGVGSLDAIRAGVGAAESRLKHGIVEREPFLAFHESARGGSKLKGGRTGGWSLDLNLD